MDINCTDPCCYQKDGKCTMNSVAEQLTLCSGGETAFIEKTRT